MFLTLITFLPLIGALFLVFMPKESVAAIKQTALAVAVADFLLSLLLWTNFDNTTHKMQFELNVPWIEAWGINFHVGLDGISLLLYVMTTFLTMICVIASWDVKIHVREYMIAMLTLSTGMLGVFIALDLFMFYVFWEFQLIPMYIIIGVWGGPAPGLCVHQVFLIHRRGLLAHAGGHPLDLFPYPGNDRSGNSGHLIYYRTFERTSRYTEMVVDGLFSGFCHQGAHVSFPHLVAGRSR